jgi:hypothetical protein
MAIDFVYTDIRDLGFGVVVVIATGVAAFLCMASEFIGLCADRECKKVGVSFNFEFNLWGRSESQQAGTERGTRTKMSCQVRCVEDAT